MFTEVSGAIDKYEIRFLRSLSDQEVERNAAYSAWSSGFLRRSANKPCIAPPWVSNRHVDIFKAGWQGEEFESVFPNQD